MPCDAGTYSALDIAAPLQLLFLLLNTPVTEIAYDFTRARGDSCSWNTEALIFINFDSAAATTAAATSCTAGEEVDGSAAAAGEEIMYVSTVCDPRRVPRVAAGWRWRSPSLLRNTGAAMQNFCGGPNPRADPRRYLLD